MSDVTEIFSQIGQGDPHAAEKLLPLVYDELRKLAEARLAREQPGQTLQPTALVHEAYLRLVSVDDPQSFNGRGHFFAAAAEAMRRILIENARRKQRVRHGGQLKRVDLEESDLIGGLPPDELLALTDAIEVLGQHDAEAASLVKVRYFAGLSVEQAADAAGLSRTTAYRHWAYAKAWLFKQLHGQPPAPQS
jgi:RNA polymerase sigma factor (TIGR02999 family)